MELRRVRPEDALRIADYHHRRWLEGYADLVEQEVLDGLRLEDRVVRWEAALRDEPEVPVVVAMVDGLAVGHVRVEADTITNVYVDPDHWGRGIGRALLSEGERILETAGYARGVLWTIVGNERAIGLYTSAGWTHDGTVEEHDTSAGVPVLEQRMTKLLVGSADPYLT